MIKVHITTGDGCPYEDSFDSKEFTSVSSAEGADIICLSGGCDINPDVYGEVNKGSMNCNPVRDKYEFELILKYVGKKPLIGICRGFQLLALFYGYKINQHDAEHSRMVYHTISNGSAVPSSHHQTVLKGTQNNTHDEVLTAVYSKSIIEAVYNAELGFFGVQWHPYAAQRSHDTFGYTYFNDKVIQLCQSFYKGDV